jgi:hypothetical protein
MMDDTVAVVMAVMVARCLMGDTVAVVMAVMVAVA